MLRFAVLAYGLTWLCWTPLVFARRGWFELPVSEELLATLGQFGPFLAALVCAAWEGGVRDVRDLLGRLVLWRVSPVWFAVALTLPPALMGAAIMIHAVVQGTVPPEVQAGELSTLLPHLAITLLIGGPLGEEPGWRGFALPRLRRWHAIPASAALGILWACWHLPLWWVADVPTSFPIYVVGVLPLTYLFTWLSDHTRGSVLIAILFHASLNTALVRMPIFPAWVAWTVLLWVVAVLISIFESPRSKSNMTNEPRSPHHFA